MVCLFATTSENELTQFWGFLEQICKKELAVSKCTAFPLCKYL